MTKEILILSGSPKKNGNTATLVDWFAEGARSKGARVEIVRTAFLKYKSTGCTSDRAIELSVGSTSAGAPAKLIIKQGASSPDIINLIGRYVFRQRQAP